MLEILKNLHDAGKITDDEFKRLETSYSEMTSKIDDARNEAKGYRLKYKDLRQYKEFAEELAGKNGVSVEDGLDEVKEALSKNSTSSDDYKALQDRYTQDTKKLKDDLLATNEKLNTTVRQNNLTSKLSKFDFHNLESALTLVNSHIVSEEDTLKYNDNGVYISLDEGLEKFATENAYLIKPKGNSGSGANNGGNGDGQKSFKDMTITEQAELYKKDAQEYERLKQKG